MFKPTTKIKKIMSQYGTSAYIFKDGLVLKEVKEVKIDKNVTKNFDIYHIIPCDTGLRTFDYSVSWGEQLPNVNMLHLYHCQLIANGFDRVTVEFNVADLGITVNVVTFVAGNHVWRDLQVNDLYGSCINISNNPYSKYCYSGYASLREWINDHPYNTSVMHGDLPEEASQKLLVMA